MTRNLNDRVLEAKAIAGLGKVMGKQGKRITSVIVPASNGTMNQVFIRRQPNAVITTECRKQVGGGNHVPCKGNLSGFCRHSLAAITMAMDEAGYKPHFRSRHDDAEKFAKRNHELALEHNGQPVVFTLKSWQSGKAKPLYMVAIDTVAEELTK